MRVIFGSQTGQYQHSFLRRARKMIRVLAKINDSQAVERIKKYGNILFVSNFTDIVGIETTTKGLEDIKHS
jgi:hypothetical protein